MAGLGDNNGLALLSRIRGNAIETPVIIVSGTGTMDDLILGVRQGITDYVRKPFWPEDVIRAIERGLARSNDVEGAVSDSLTDIDGPVRKKLESVTREAGLTSREVQVLELLLLGRSASEAGEALGIKARTIKFHTGNLLRKLGADSRTDLFRVFL